MSSIPLSVLLVEDNPAHVILIRRALEKLGVGASLRVCGSVASATRCIASETPDIVIADLNLTDGKGTKLIAYPHDVGGYPLILMTSFGDENIAADAIKSGALDYLVKSPEAFARLPLVVRRVQREWQNILARKRAQDALLLKEREQEEILNSINDAVVTIDDAGSILTFNAAAIELFGFGSQEIIGQSVTRLMIESDLANYADFLRRYLEKGEENAISNGGRVEVYARHKLGHVFLMRLAVSELPSIDGKRRFVGSCYDLTQIRQQEEQLHRSQKLDALGKLTGGIAHDFNNMLGIVMGYAGLLQQELKAQPELTEYVEEILRAGGRGAKLTEQLLAFTRHKTAVDEKLNINALLKEGESRIRKTLGKRISIDYSLTENIWPVWIDAGDLKDAVTHLCSNAMQAIENSGKVTITTRNERLSLIEGQTVQLAPGDYVMLSVTDTGCGMDKALRDKIFDPFFSTHGDQGMGLGLSQVYGFVERSDGEIRVYSELTHGSQFTIYFPRFHDTSEDEQTEEARNELRPPRSAVETILVVDDEPVLLKLASQILDQQGYRVLGASSAMQALKILRNDVVDLLLTDVVMPEVNGYQLAAMVQKEHPQVRIQLASGFADKRHRGMVSEGLSQALLHKPYNAKKLLKRVRALMDT